MFQVNNMVIQYFYILCKIRLYSLCGVLNLCNMFIYFFYMFILY